MTPLTIRSALILLACCAIAQPALAQAEQAPAQAPAVAMPAAGDAATAEELFQLHGQLTYVTQKHPRFRSPYQGANSLAAFEPAVETLDLTLFIGVRLWHGAELYLNPEIDQGYGLSNTLGVAGYPSGEAYKVGNWTPYGRMPRIFIRQTWALYGPPSAVESGANALQGMRADNRVTLTVGKFSVVDLFDSNAYAHDPRSDFLNWSIIESGAFDYAADAWGYTMGAALEWNQGDWTLRGGLFALSTQPNGVSIDMSFAQKSWVVEVERRFKWLERPGALRALGFLDQGRVGRYDEAVALGERSGAAPETALVRRSADKSGWALNLEQGVADGVGLFARLSGSGGQTETFAFTDIHRSLATGLSLQGERWSRPLDTIGVAAAVNGLSSAARAYFAAGGLGPLIGDGQLPRYRSERIVETYYAARVSPALTLSVDGQYIANPAYNPDRGPVKIFGLRLHAQL